MYWIELVPYTRIYGTGMFHYFLLAGIRQNTKIKLKIIASTYNVHPEPNKQVFEKRQPTIGILYSQFYGND